MITYQVAIEPHGDDFRAHCPAIPGAEHVAGGPDAALAGLPDKLNAVLIGLYLSGKPYPPCQMMERGMLSVTPSFHWTGTAS